MPTANEFCASQKILNVQDNDLAQFLRDEIREKRLSEMMQQLNAQLMSADQEARDLAAKAIERLGFMVES